MIRLKTALRIAPLAIWICGCDMGEVPEPPPPNLDGLLQDVAGTQGVGADGGAMGAQQLPVRFTGPLMSRWP